MSKHFSRRAKHSKLKLSQSRRARSILSAARLRRVIRYVRAHSADRITLTVLAEIAGVPAEDFTRVFGGAIGISSHRFVYHERISRACTMLAAGSITPSELSQAVGFLHSRRFAQYFERATEVNPARLLWPWQDRLTFRRNKGRGRNRVAC